MAKKSGITNSSITIGKTVVEPGNTKIINIPLAPLATHDELSMSVYVKVGKKAGPVMFVCAAIHGDELNGVDVIRRLVTHPALKRMSGTLLAIPIVNVHGFLHQTRYLPDGRDLNRIFPGSSTGSLSSRVAKKFVDEILKKSDFGIDLHTGARHRENLPQLRLNFDNKDAKALAAAFGVPVTLHSKVRDGSLREAATELNIPVLMFEGGEALRFDELSIRAGLQGVLNVMRHKNMLSISKRKKPLPEPLYSTRSVWIRTPTSGLIRLKFELGQRVKENDILAVISDPLGKSETHVISSESGIIIGRSLLPVVNEGDAVFHIACYKNNSVEAENALQEMQINLDGMPSLDI